MRLWLMVLFFNMLVCAYCRHVGWMLFWAFAFSSCAYDYGYEHGNTEERSSRSDHGCGVGTGNL